MKKVVWVVTGVLLIIGLVLNPIFLYAINLPKTTPISTTPPPPPPPPPPPTTTSTDTPPPTRPYEEEELGDYFEESFIPAVTDLAYSSLFILEEIRKEIKDIVLEEPELPAEEDRRRY
ncbi:MAG: hypothetical protein JSW17_05160 [Candidatus Omnitrophota bacterium]|nr:MAG: hypothetical protein JSW17_05160 [Candidatus Omnitrophota bacterium]